MKRRIFRSAVTAVLVFALSIPAFATQMLVPVGKVVGLSLMDGSVTVVAFDNQLGDGAREAGLKLGDDIISIDGHQIDSLDDLQAALKCSDGTLDLVVGSEGDQRSLKLSPSITPEGPKLGVYIREGISGIGTVTYYDPQSSSFGALGHGISTGGSLADLRSGTVCRASVSGIRVGQAGSPGQLKGSVQAEAVIGSLQANTDCGIFGKCSRFGGEPLPVASADQVTTGEATILSNISGDEIREYTVEIEKIYTPINAEGRNLLIRVTDPELLSATGGIVAGMSGSPIIQDGYLIGAVTHVLVNDPTMGYGIFIENMLDAAG